MVKATASQSLVCRECDWVMERPFLEEHETAHCPRCGARVHTPHSTDSESLMAWSLGALLMLGLGLHFSFISFEARGVRRTITLFDTATVLLDYRHAFLAGLIGLTTVILPALYLVSVFYVSLSRELGIPLPDVDRMSRLMGWIRPWMMSDVFLVGVLIGLIKIVSLARIEVGPSFWAFGAYLLMFLKVTIDFEPTVFWEQFGGEPASPSLDSGRPAHEQQTVGCAHCGRPFDANPLNVCPRCGRWHPLGLVDRWQLTLALLVTAAILYVPAQVYPIMEMERLTSRDPSTIAGGVMELYRTGSWPIALIIFLASVVVPLAKIMTLGWLCVRLRLGNTGDPRYHMWLYRVTERIGRWSMIDIYVVALLVALVQVGGYLTVYPGPAAISFALVVVVTMLAAITFDPRWIWHPERIKASALTS